MTSPRQRHSPLRRRLLGTISAGLGSALLPALAQAQIAYPAKPIRMIVPFASGGGTDVIGRLLGQRLATYLGQNLLIDNRGGAGGTLGAAQLAQAAPDGYTMMFTSLAPVTIAPNLPGMMVSYDAQKDLMPVAMVAQQPVLIVVNAKVRATTLRELLEIARSRPGRLTYATPGIGTELHLIGEMLKLSAGVDIVHVPYRGGGPAITDLIGGTVDMMPVVTSSIMPHVKSGAVRVLATVSRERLPGLPNVPTAAEAGLKDVVATPSWGVFAPAGTSGAVVTAWSQALRKIIKEADYSQRLAELGAGVNLLETQEFSAYLAQERAQWKRVIEQGKLKAE